MNSFHGIFVFQDKWVLEHDDVILGQSIGRVRSFI